ncbi:hypothetical protein BJ085DRAFT_28092 [Dimargaris cristalligena]|uniref:Uncharacterized protein n=1 Tax=Dimargaris cristalligena TaxID=215637 RepID=A0A4V1J411_9FUNG|nr:hypothetical protein BJ085DRAFT_28092 [Dimargaris cristalligena]|eukprot:RKP33939.1 hypothetical protein BJ085DRAFT_28092 [Dimargaris cristalligena]
MKAYRSTSLQRDNSQLTSLYHTSLILLLVDVPGAMAFISKVPPTTQHGLATANNSSAGHYNQLDDQAAAEMQKEKSLGRPSQDGAFTPDTVPCRDYDTRQPTAPINPRPPGPITANRD